MTITQELKTGLLQLNKSFLNLDSSNLTDEDAIELATLLKNKTHINKISACDNLFGEQGAKALLSIRHLKEVNLSNSGITDNVFQEIASNLRLKTLTIGDTQVTTIGLACLLKNPLLEMLDVADSPIIESDLFNINLPVNETLKRLYLKSPIGDKGIIKLMANRTSISL